MKIQNAHKGKYIKARQLQLPNEILGRFSCLGGHRNLREQRDTFSSVLIHPCGVYRWCLPLFMLPYHHIVETSKYGEEVRLHIYHPCTQNVVTLQMCNKQWSCLGGTPDDLLDQVIPDRCMRTQWLSNPATKGQRWAVKRITGSKVLVSLTAVNANVIIHTHALMPHMQEINQILDDWTVDIKSAKQAV